MWTNKRKL